MSDKNSALRIARTVTPPERPDFNAWCRELRVSSRIPMTRTKRNIR